MAGVYGSLCNIGAPGFSALVAAVFVIGVFGCCGVRGVVAGLLLCFGAFPAHAFTGPRDGGTVQLFGGAVDTGAFGNVVGVFPSGQLQQCDDDQGGRKGDTKGDEADVQAEWTLRIVESSGGDDGGDDERDNANGKREAQRNFNAAFESAAWFFR